MADEDKATAGAEPIGEALRATYDADNHDSLGNDLTGLMLALARVDDAPPPPASPPNDVARQPSWRDRLFRRPRRSTDRFEPETIAGSSSRS